MNPYLQNLRDKYDGLRTGIEGLQTRAADENRDLTEDELRSVSEQAEQAKRLAAQIEDLTEIETRNRKVAELAANVASGTDTDETRSTRVGTAKAQDRDPGHYTRSSAHSFFSDMYRARTGDEGASRRLAEHNRALTTGSQGPGVVPPHWLTQEFETLARQGRRVASAVRQVPLGDDPRPLTLPKQTAGVDSVVAEQSSENTHPSETDAWDSDVTTVTPKPTAGIQVVSRQMLDMSNPAIDQLIYGDLLAAYNQKIEAKVVAAMTTSAGTAVTAYATEAAWTTAITNASGDVPVVDDLVDLAIAVRNARKLPADVLVLSVLRYGDLLKLKDSTGRPLMPLESAGPMNVIGTGSVAVDGRFHGLGVIATDGITQYPESILAARASDTLLFESAVTRFRFEEVAGPESVKLGIWAYSAVHVKYAGASVKRNQITAAS